MSSGNLPPGVSQSDLEPDDAEYCRHCDSAPCRCDRLEDRMDQMRLEGKL